MVFVTLFQSVGAKNQYPFFSDVFILSHRLFLSVNSHSVIFISTIINCAIQFMTHDVMVVTFVCKSNI